MNPDDRYCPECGADWRAGQIPPESIQKDHYGHEAPCQRKPNGYSYNGVTTACTCDPRYYSRLIGVEDPYKYDGVSWWLCPDCAAKWSRWTGELVTE